MFDISHLHPITVHFPIVLILTGFLADVLGLILKNDKSFYSKAGFYIQALAMIAVVVAFLTGEYFSSNLSGEAGEMKERHELFGKITMFIIIAATLYRAVIIYLDKDRNTLKYIYIFLYFLAVLSVSYTGLLGGTLVYNFMVGL